MGRGETAAGAASAAGAAAGGGNRPKQRLMISKLVLQNFKSYAGTKEIGPFHKCFSSVVGPNGSGKSNVIDAMLFVFGKRAKQLRLNKVSELIHRSEAFPNLESATVSVHFQEIVDKRDDLEDDDAYDVVPGSEVVVTRSAFLNNQSKYLLDGKPSTYGEVTALLRTKGIDLDHNRFLILQGEVEQIAMMKPKAPSPHEDGLLEYLEDIIGSNRHVARIEELGKEVDALNEARAEQLNRVKITEKEVEALEGAKAEAEALQGKERELRQRKAALYQLAVYEAQENLEGLARKHDALAEKLAYEKGKLAASEAELQAFEGELAKVQAAHEAAAAALAAAKEEFASFERRDIKLQEDEKFLKASLKKAKAAGEKEAKKGKEAEAKAEAKEAALPSLEAACVSKKKEAVKAEAAVESILESVQGKTAELRSQLEAAQEELAPKKEASVALQTRLATLETEASLVRSQAAQAQSRLAAAEERLGKIGGLKEAKAAAIKEAEARVAGAVEQERQAAQAAVAAAEEKEKELAAQMKAAVAAAEEAKAALQQSSALSGTQKALLQAARKGGPLEKAGVCGRLGDLGGIDDRYDVAVSTAAGALDYIVVETAKGGSACVEYLRQHNLGRASFIILEQLGYLSGPMSATFNPPSKDAPRLYDLVRPSHDRFRPAFYMALRNTLVAPTLDRATQIAYQGNKCAHRVVTLDGQLIDASGAMSGGGKNVKRGAMGTAAKSGGGGGGGKEDGGGEAEAQRLAAVATEVEAALRLCRQEKKAAAEKLKALDAEAKKLTASLPKLRMDLESFAQEATELAAKIEALKPQCALAADAQQRIQELEAEKEEVASALRAGEKEVGRLEGKVKALQAAILDVGGPKLKAAQAAVAKAKEAEEAAVEAVNAAKVEASTARRALEKAEAAVEAAGKEAEECQLKLEQAKGDRKALEEEAFACAQALEGAEKAAGETKQEVDGLLAKHAGLKERVALIKNVEVDIADQLEEYSRVKAENEAKAAHWAKELEKLRKAHAEDMASDPTLQEGEGEEEEDGGGGSSDEGEEDEMEEGEGKPRLSKMVKRRQALALPEYDAAGLSGLDKEALKYRIGLLEQERDALKENVNMRALAEYRSKAQEHKARLKELDAATDTRNETRKRHDDARRQRLEEFMSGFGQITLKLKEMYQMITLGGDAELELVDSLDPFSEGIVFSVRPPKKSWKNIANLSGGEKTLSSLALVFALHHYKPTPLYVMDEIDAALDFKNVSIVGNYIKEACEKLAAQFIIISLRSNMFELAPRLCGIYKVDNSANCVVINPAALARAQRSSQEAAAAKAKDGPAVAASSAQPLMESTNLVA